MEGTKIWKIAFEASKTGYKMVEICDLTQDGQEEEEKRPSNEFTRNRISLLQRLDQEKDVFRDVSEDGYYVTIGGESEEEPIQRKKKIEQALKEAREQDIPEYIIFNTETNEIGYDINQDELEYDFI